jgi:hypothetical protein
MQRLKRNSFQNQQIQRSLGQFNPFFGHLFFPYRFDIRSLQQPLSKRKGKLACQLRSIGASIRRPNLRTICVY